jgi:hypothetical protein
MYTVYCRVVNFVRQVPHLLATMSLETHQNKPNIEEITTQVTDVSR